MIQVCSRCGRRVIPKSDGTCPSCGASFAVGTAAADAGSAAADRPPAVPGRDVLDEGRAFLVAGWVLFAVGVLSIVGRVLLPVPRPPSPWQPPPTSPAEVLLIVVGLAAYAATCIMVGSDAYKLRLGELKRSSLVLSSTERSSPGAWLAGCLLVWIVFFPLYLAWRLKLARAARQTIEGRLYMNDEQIGEAKRKEHRRAFVWLAVVALLVLLLVGVCVAVSR